MDVKPKSVDDSLKDPLRAILAEGALNISRTALFTKATSSRLQKKSNALDHA
jgi:hypothetical protein